MELGIEYVPDEWPHGLRCIDCHVLFVEGMRYSQRLESIIPPEPVGDVDPSAPEWVAEFASQPTALVHIVCVGCALVV
jgi:hypothetical protein